MNKKILVCVMAFLFGGCVLSNASQEVSIIPRPDSIAVKSGSFLLNEQTVICYNGNSDSDICNQAAEMLLQDAKLSVKVSKSKRLRRNAICFNLDSSASSLGSEGYILNVDTKKIEITSSGESGLFYGLMSLLQLLPADSNVESGSQIEIPCVYIKDFPRFEWRGFMLDSSRYYQSPEFIKGLLKNLARYKINKFHWHFVDDQAWRYCVSKYPELTKDIDPKLTDQGVYTKEQIKDVVAYAASLQITVYPEIEIPGHSSTVIQKHPGLSCHGHGREYCLANQGTRAFLKDVLNEVFKDFPSEYVHIGGDEADATNWKSCSKCQALIKKLGYQDCAKLQNWYMNGFSGYLQGKGKTAVVWADHLKFGIDDNTIVQAWHPWETTQALDQRARVINSDNLYLYFDYPIEPGALMAGWMSFLPMSRTYNFEPVPADTSKDKADLLIGVESCLWTEEVKQADSIKKIFPRLLAFAELAWTQKEKRFWPEFLQRAKLHRKNLVRYGIEYYPASEFNDWNAARLTKNGKNDLRFDLADKTPRAGIYELFLLDTETGLPVKADVKLFADRGKEVSLNFLQDRSVYEFAIDAKSNIRAEICVMDKKTDRDIQLFINYKGVLIGQWSKDQFSGDYKTVKWNISDIVDAAGAYDLWFEYERGGGALEIDSVSIIQDDTLADKSLYSGAAGVYWNYTNRIGLKEFDKNSTYELMINAKTSSDGSDGKIWMKYLPDCELPKRPDDLMVARWYPSQMSETPLELKWDVTEYITAGELSFKFDYEKGQNMLVIESAMLLENGQVIAKDVHRGQTGASDTDNEYQFALAKKKAGAKYELAASVFSDGGTNSYGYVWHKKR